MKIDIHDKRVSAAIDKLKYNNPSFDKDQLDKLFESKYHCKIVIDPDDPWVSSGHVEFENNKYQTSFILQFDGALLE